MSFEDYANHISKKLKLAVSLAIIRSVPENLTTNEYINQLKSNILDKKDADSEISVCSDDFELDDSHSDHNLINDKDKSDNNNNSDNNPINNGDVLINNTQEENINIKIDNIVLINDMKAVTVNRNDENNTNFEINDRENDYTIINGEENDIFNTVDNISLGNDYDSLIEKVLQLDESQTILHDFCMNDIGNTDNMSNNRESNVKYCEKMSTQGTSNATQTLDFNDETYYQSIEDTNTEKTAKTYQEAPNSDIKRKKDDSLIIIDDTNTKRYLKQNIIEDGPSTKRRRNEATKLQTNKRIEDPNSRIKNNISKFLDKNNIASKTKVITKNVKVKDSLETVNKKLDQNTECTQTNTYYSQSQPLLVIDQKYMYEKSKSIPRIEKAQNLDTDVTKKDLSISANHTKATKMKINNITDINSIAKDISPKQTSEASNYKTNTMKIIENNTAFQFEREIYLFSQTSVCGVRNDDKSTEDINNNNTNDSNNKTNTATNEGNRNYNKEEKNTVKYNLNSKSEEEMQSTIDLRPQSKQNLYNRNRNRDNSHRYSNNEATQSTVDLYSQDFQQNNNNGNRNNNSINIGDNNHSNNNNETTQSTVDLFSQECKQNNNNRNRDNNNRNIDNNDRNNNNEPFQSTVDLFSHEFQQNNINRNRDDNNEPTQSTANTFSQQNNNRNQDNNRDRNNNNNETTLTQNTFKNLPTENLNEDEEINNQSRNSDSDLTDSDDVQTEEVIPFKIVEELNKIKVYLNKIERVTDSSSDTGYRSDSQSRHSMKMSQSIIWLNQSAHCLFTYIRTCQLISNTEEITGDISIVLAQLIQKLYDEETYLSFMEEVLDTVDSLLQLVLNVNSGKEFLKKDETIQRILLLNKSTHVQKYTIDKITQILEDIHENITTKDTLYEAENIGKIENSCYIFHILHIILQRYYYKSKEKLTKKQDNSQKSQLERQKSQFGSQKSQYNSQQSQLKNQKSEINSQKSQFDSQKSQFNGQKSQFEGQKSQSDGQKSQFDSQKSQFSSLNSQEVLKKTDISDIWRKKWNPNFKEERNEDNIENKCPLTDCSKVLNKLIVSCMDGYRLIAYFALKCFNLMQS